ncbi:MAG TPA: alpha/beta hydrolase [Fimbriimonas sp.]|nr:alpha/beta hydrolase [Fimbriimonas sp.]
MKHVHVWQPGSSRRTLVMLHGTGGDEHSLISLAQALDPTANVLSPLGNVSESSAPRFFRRLAEGVFDIPDLIARTHDLADFIEEASLEYGFDPQRTVAVGYSNGANIAASCLLLRPEAFCGAVLIRAMVPLEPDNLPNLIGKRVLILTGEFDPILPAENAQRLATMLRQYGADVTWELLRAGHELTRRDVEISSEWLGSLCQ